MSLGTQALIQLGEVQPPHGMAVEVDVDAAKQTIDILAMIEGKTQGNLDDSEQKLLEGMLHNLRLSYVAKNK